mmetsp:Transcript_72290/g.182274  ORF Transcript_72290/g.182274 Transcript_72290/m.182274 type:complete len:248 (-) Transcript_72290:1081-1824(-)
MLLMALTTRRSMRAWTGKPAAGPGVIDQVTMVSVTDIASLWECLVVEAAPDAPTAEGVTQLTLGAAASSARMLHWQAYECPINHPTLLSAWNVSHDCKASAVLSTAGAAWDEEHERASIALESNLNHGDRARECTCLCHSDRIEAVEDMRGQSTCEVPGATHLVLSIWRVCHQAVLGRDHECRSRARKAEAHEVPLERRMSDSPLDADLCRAWPEQDVSACFAQLRSCDGLPTCKTQECGPREETMR